MMARTADDRYRSLAITYRRLSHRIDDALDARLERRFLFLAGERLRVRDDMTALRQPAEVA